MDRTSAEKSIVAKLYPAIDAFDRRYLDVGDGHLVYMEQSGNPLGQPVVVLHGGPGGGCSPVMRRYFDPSKYRVILFDQRGCGRSTPRGCVEDNTTWKLVNDIEHIRTVLDIDSWIVFGGSWGAALGLIYAQSHPSRVRHLVLRGVFTMTRPELDWFYGGGAGIFWPEQWERFRTAVPEDERGDLIAAYHRRLFSGDLIIERKFAQIWSGWENALATLRSTGNMSGGSAEFSHVFARLECHYFFNDGFISSGQHIAENMHRIQQIPGTIVQGRYDLICPPRTAIELARSWQNAELHMVADAGHAMSEPGISAALVTAMDKITARN